MKNFVVYEKSSGRVVASGTSFNPESLSDNFHEVIVTDRVLEIDKIFIVNELIKELPKKPDGNYQFNYQTRSWVIDLESIERDVLRKRAAMLSDSDWTQLPDVPLATRQAWADYRQALRDITAQLGYPLSVAWPAAPSN